jgi:hypothetical protein
MGSVCYQGACVTQSCGMLTCGVGNGCVNGACRDVACEGVVCQSGSVCITGACVTSTCTDRLRGGDESDVDCGGSCPTRCAQGATCGGAADCASNNCALGRCVPPSTCGNLVKDGSETDVDCGGTCPRRCAVGQVCAINTDCASGQCPAMVCTQSVSCSNLVKDGLESDVDCGGAACSTRCFVGRTCLIGSDCVTNSCAAGLCVGATCTDGARNGLESDVDCGGTCVTKCASGQRCGSGADCASSPCVMNVCAQPSCTDGFANGTEADVDCGGSCTTKCRATRQCLQGTDCLSGVCMSGRCTADPSCSDGLRNQDEVGVDCGGASCAPCPSGQPCNAPADCATFFCSGQPRRCSNGFDPAVDTAVSGFDGYMAGGRANGDGYGDLVVTMSQQPAFLLGTPSGQLTVPTTLPFPACASTLACPVQDLVFLDVTSDGIDDLVVSGQQYTNPFYSWVRVLRGVGNSTFQGAIESGVPVNVPALGRISAGELNGTAGVDLVFGRSWFQFTPTQDSAIVVMSGTGLGSFSASIVTGYNAVYPRGSAVADLDGDGIAEAIVSMQNNPTRVLRRGAMGLEFSTASLNFGATALATADLNGDGRRDVLGVNGGLVVALNQGNLTFLPPIAFAGADGDLFVRDWNGDGRLDVVTTRAGGIGVFIGDGTGGFSVGPRFGQSTGRLAIGDFNGDGKMDIASAGPNVVHVYLAQ